VTAMAAMAEYNSADSVIPKPQFDLEKYLERFIKSILNKIQNRGIANFGFNPYDIRIYKDGEVYQEGLGFMRFLWEIVGNIITSQLSIPSIYTEEYYISLKHQLIVITLNSIAKFKHGIFPVEIYLSFTEDDYDKIFTAIYVALHGGEDARNFGVRCGVKIEYID